jgi:hypothetical protein
MIVAEIGCTKCENIRYFKRLALCAWMEKFLLDDRGSSLMKGHTYVSISK